MVILFVASLGFFPEFVPGSAILVQLEKDPSLAMSYVHTGYFNPKHSFFPENSKTKTFQAPLATHILMNRRAE